MRPLLTIEQEKALIVIIKALKISRFRCDQMPISFKAISIAIFSIFRWGD